jgi:hypothetical protein
MLRAKLLLFIIIFASMRLFAAANNFDVQSVCAQNSAGGLCTNPSQTIIKVEGSNKSPSYLNRIPPELLPKLKITPAPAPVFNK